MEARAADVVGLASDARLRGSEDVEHEGQADTDQLLAVVFLPDGGELSEQRQGDPRPGLLLGTTQRFQPHVELPRDTCPKRRPWQFPSEEQERRVNLPPVFG